MKKIFIYSLTLALILTGCKQTDNESPDSLKTPSITIEEEVPTQILVSADGGTVSIAYSIGNPVEGGFIEAIPENPEWIENINCETPGSISLDVLPNKTEETRNTVLTISYIYDTDLSVETQTNIIQEAGIAYDVECEATDLSGTWYGDEYGNGLHNYYTWVSDKSFAEYGFSAPDASYYLFDIYGPAPEDETNPRPVAGTYTYSGSVGTDTYTFYSELTPTDSDGGIQSTTYFEEGTLIISYEDGQMVMSASLVDGDGLKYHVTYRGDATYADESGGSEDETIINEDITFDSQYAIADYYSGDGETMSLLIQLSNMEFGEYGSTTPPGKKLVIRASMPFNQEGYIATGNYEMGFGDSNLKCTIGFLDADGSPSGTYIYNYPDESYEYQYGLLTSGTMTVSGGEGVYDIECDFTTEEGYSIKTTYAGSIETGHMPEVGFSTLTDDYTLNLEGAICDKIFYYGDFFGTGGGNWIVKLMPDEGVTCDGFQFEIVCEGLDEEAGIPSGTYTAANSKYPKPGEYMQGYLEFSALQGTMYLGDFNQWDVASAYAPAMSGDLIITNKGNDIYHIEFDFIDDLGHHWDGEWEGELVEQEFEFPWLSPEK